MLIGQGFQLRGKDAERRGRIGGAEKDSARKFDLGRCGGSARRAGRRQPADVHHFVGMNFKQQTIEAPAAGPLLGNERNRQSSAKLRFVQPLEELNERQAAKAIARRRGGPGFGADVAALALQRDGIEHIHAGGADFSRAGRADVHIYFVGMIHLWRVLAKRLKMHG